MSNPPRDASALSTAAARVAWLRTFGGLESAGPVLFAASALACLCFIGLAALVMDGDTRAVDERLMMALRSPLDAADPIGPKWFAGYMRDITALGGFAVLSLLVLSVTGFLLATNHRRTALRIFAIALSGWLASHAAKLVFMRPRPDLVPHGAEVYASSFPSGHAMTSAVVYLTLGAALARASDDRLVKIYVLTLATALVFLIGASRVYLGVHWPSDVLGGWMLGAAWVGICWSALRALDSRAAAH